MLRLNIEEEGMKDTITLLMMIPMNIHAHIILLKKELYWLNFESILKELELTADTERSIQYIIEALEELFPAEQEVTFEKLNEACYRFTEKHIFMKSRTFIKDNIYQEKKNSLQKQYGVDWYHFYIKWVIKDCYFGIGGVMRTKPIEIENASKFKERATVSRRFLSVLKKLSSLVKKGKL